jgi:hypothetical protein
MVPRVPRLGLCRVMLEDECIKENKHSCEAIVKWAPVFGNLCPHLWPLDTIIKTILKTMKNFLIII